MNIMKRFFYVMSLNWILTFVDKHITSEGAGRES